MMDNLARELYRSVFASDDYPDGDLDSQDSKPVYNKKGNVLFPDSSRNGTGKGYDMNAVNELLKSGINEDMYKDRELTVIDDDAIDDEGNWGFGFYKTGRKVIANFSKALSKYTGKAYDYMNNIRLLNMSSVYDHEGKEVDDKGYTPHGEMSAEEILETRNPIRRMAKLALVEIGLEQGTEQSVEIASVPGIMEEIRGYNKDDGWKGSMYKIIRSGTSKLHGIPDPGYRLSISGGD